MQDKIIAQHGAGRQTYAPAYRAGNFPFRDSKPMVIALLILRRAGLSPMTCAVLAITVLIHAMPASAQSASVPRMTATASARVVIMQSNVRLAAGQFVIMQSNVRLAAGQLRTSSGPAVTNGRPLVGVSVRDRPCEHTPGGTGSTATRSACTMRIYDLP